MSEQSDFVSGGGIYPTLKADPTYPTPSIHQAGQHQSRRMSGFDGDGDQIELPSTSTDTMTYTDELGNQSADGYWDGSLSLANVNSAIGVGLADVWIGFTLSGGLLYAAVEDTGSNEINLISITKLGVITPVGAGVTPTAFGLTPVWSAPASSSASSLSRAPDGTGNFFIRVVASGLATEELELLFADGSIVTNTTTVAGGACHYKTASGIYAGGFSGASGVSTAAAPTTVIDVSNSIDSAVAAVPHGSGVPSSSASSSGYIPLQWDGRIVMGAPNTNNVNGSRGFTIAEFDRFIDKCAKAVGVI